MSSFPDIFFVRYDSDKKNLVIYVLIVNEAKLLPAPVSSFQILCNRIPYNILYETFIGK